MPYVSLLEALNFPLVNLDAVCREQGSPPWRVPLIGTPTTRWVLLSWPAGYVTVPHYHPRGDEAFHVLRGTAIFRIGDAATDYLAEPGALLLAPRGVIHTIGVPGPEPLLLLCSVSPNEDAADETVEDPSASGLTI